MAGGRAWCNEENLLPLCEVLPARAIARLAATRRDLRASLLALWPTLRSARGPTLQRTPLQGLLRLHRLESFLLYEEFGDAAWDQRWRLDPAALAEPGAAWSVGPGGLHLKGIGGRALDLRREFCPPAVALSVAAETGATPDEAAALGYVVLADAERRPCAWVYFEWSRDVVGAPSIACWVNEQRVDLMDYPWPCAVEVAFEFDWAAKELTDVSVCGSRVLRGEGIDFHSAECRGVRHVLVSNRRGARGGVARARWESLQLWPERRVLHDPWKSSRPPFMEMLI
mmetsp:Transcript_91983/g.259882  ORF Transcript_91983/g.259882 Transcript_91983/m.259882 type:complete len:284 (-) Transcript_91983:112-963(-)